MQITSSDMSPISPTVDVMPPDEELEARIHLRPFGRTRTGSRHLWTFDADEAEQLGWLLVDAARQARSLNG